MRVGDACVGNQLKAFRLTSANPSSRVGCNAGFRQSDRARPSPCLLNIALLIRTLQYKAMAIRARAEVRDARVGGIMRKWLRRVRGAIGIGITWAAAWSAAGAVPRWVFGFNADAPFPLIFGALGFIAGVTFSGLLVLAEGRRRFDQMSLPRFAGWGAIGGLVLSALFAKAASLGWGDVLAIAPTFALACAICASASLALARRALKQELPDMPRV